VKKKRTLPHKNSACSAVGGWEFGKAMQHELRAQFHKKPQAQLPINAIYKTVDKKRAHLKRIYIYIYIYMLRASRECQLPKTIFSKFLCIKFSAGPSSEHGRFVPNMWKLQWNQSQDKKRRLAHKI
jgi:hypothetical protein